MSDAVHHDRLRILVGDARERLRELPDASMHCVVTSPPYWGLRDYGTEPQVWGGDPGCEHDWQSARYYVEGGGGARSSAEAFSAPGPGNAERIRKARWREDDTCAKCGAWRGHLGLEPTPGLYVEHLVEVFREVRRVLRADGTVWLVIGDSYAQVGGNNWGSAPAVPEGARPAYARGDRTAKPDACGGRSARRAGLKPKDLVMMPARVALALQADGWLLRSDIVWAKGISFCPTYAGAVMPESVRDRPTKSHEYVFLLAKDRKYYFDMEAVKEPCAESSRRRIAQRTFHKQRGGRKDYARGINRNRSARRALENFAASFERNGGRRHPRTVWAISPRSYRGAHFAVYPEKLVEPCIRAGTSEKGCCPGCGAPWERMLGPKKPAGGRGSGNKRRKHRNERDGLDDHLGSSVPWKPTVAGTVGWRPSCDCNAGDPVPCVVLDPFLGSGTTALVALRLGRAAVGIELNPEYAEMARQRIESGLGRAEVERPPRCAAGG